MYGRVWLQGIFHLFHISLQAVKGKEAHREHLVGEAGKEAACAVWKQKWSCVGNYAVPVLVARGSVTRSESEQK